MMENAQDPFPQVSQILEAYFDIPSIQSGDSLKSLLANSGTTGLCSLLKTSSTSGIDASTIDIREKSFGKNEGYTRERHSIFHIIWEALQDTVLEILIAAAFISLIVGSVEDSDSGWVEGVAILMAVVIVLAVTATNDYIKDGQFIKLSRTTNIHRVTVTRDNREQEIPASALVVGDLMHITPGEVLNVDGILVKSTKIAVDESAISGESAAVNKQALGGSGNLQPFLVSGSKVIEGYGLMIVCGVGVNSINEKIRKMSGAENEEEETPLQERLGNLAVLLGKIGLVAGIVLALILGMYAGVEALENHEWTSDETSDLVTAFIIGVTVLVVAIPEGLPLALTLSMAYSVIRMKEENIFVRHIRGCEIMGAATNILTDKTGTLTENRMKVTSAVLYQKKFVTAEKISLSRDEENLLCKAICRNTTAFYKTVNGVEEISGSRTEGAMIDLVKSFNQDIYVYRDPEQELFKFAFTSESKKMTTVYNLYNNGFEVYTKGAAEVVVGLCKFYQSETGRVEELNEGKAEAIYKQIEELSKKKMRVLGIAYRISDQVIEEHPQEEFEKDLILIGLLGMQDKIRKEAKDSVAKVLNAGIIVRMVTGDNIETAISVAQATGIIDSNISEEELQASVMTGKEFREQSGGFTSVKDDQGAIQEFKLVDKESFHNTVKYLRVLARCSPEDKLLLTIGLKELGEVVAMIGDGSNDAAALKQSDLGVAMVSGTQLAKQSSDIILLDDNFNSVVNTVKWGRNVYASTRKFLQFQLTVNVVALVCSIIGGASLRTPPITAVQMLWVNLIMDSFAALALATEPPNDNLLNSKPFGRTEDIIIRDMIITVVTQCVYQIVILLVILYFGPKIFDVDEGWGNDNWTEENGKHFTIFFHTFVLLQIFNEINCRKISMFEVNVFKNFFNNWMFQAIVFVTFVVQFMLVEFGGEFLNCSQLSIGVHLVCFGIGASGLAFGVTVRAVVSGYRMKDFKTSTKKERYGEDYKLLNDHED